MHVVRGSRLLIPRSSRCLQKTQRHTEWPCPLNHPPQECWQSRLIIFSVPTLWQLPSSPPPQRLAKSLYITVFSRGFCNRLYKCVSCWYIIFFFDIYYKRLLIACCLLVKVIITCMSWFVLIFVMEFSLWKWHYSIVNGWLFKLLVDYWVSLVDVIVKIIYFNLEIMRVKDEWKD